MKIRKKVDRGTHNLLMSCQVIPLYKYEIDGIYLSFGPWKGRNLTEMYRENYEGCLDYLDNIIDADETPYKLKIITKQVINDLMNDYYSI